MLHPVHTKNALPGESAETGITILTSHDAVDDLAWNNYVERHPDASIYHGTAWQRVIEQAFSKKVYRLVAVTTAGDIRGVLPLVRLNGWFLPDMLVSMPYCSFGGELADNADVAVALLNRARELREMLACDVVEIRSPGLTNSPNSWRRRNDKVQMVLELPASVEALGKLVGSKRRSQIKRSLRENPEVLVGGAELIPNFFCVFARKMRDLGTPVYPRRFFEIVAMNLNTQFRVLVLSIETQPVAAAFLLRHGDSLEIPWAASDSRYNRSAVNMLLYWEALRYAIENGCVEFDFGRCTRDGPTYKFKRQWGAEARELSWRVNSENGGGRTSSLGGSALLLSNAWKRLPLSTANWLGPHIAPNLPW
jgi:serine/alanine adding enzyme